MITAQQSQTVPHANVDQAPGISHGVGSSILTLLLWQSSALCLQVFAVSMARQGQVFEGNMVSCLGFGVTFASAVWFLTRPDLHRIVRNAAVACLGVTPFVQSRLIDPMVFTNFDEQLHLRSLRDMTAAHGLFEPNPLLAVSPRYPGVEAVAAVFEQFGLPAMAAATVVILLSRLVLVSVLCDAVENLTGSARAGGIAVAVYAVSPQFVFFNSQFSYQTLALPLAVAAVALVARARWRPNAHLLLGGATICMAAVTVTHHVTGLLTAAFLLAWTVAERGTARRRVGYAAAVCTLAVAGWAFCQRTILFAYFAPMTADVGSQVSGDSPRRVPFTDAAGTTTTPQWERFFLVFYALVVALAATWLAWSWCRSAWIRSANRARSGSESRWHPSGLLVLFVAMIPVLLAGRSLPSGGEMFDRASSFLYLPLSCLLADGIVRSRRVRAATPPSDTSRRRGRTVGWLCVALASAIFVGGYQLGSGPYWGRLPGAYLVVADFRSMDAETLAATKWASEGLPAGSRIGADRVGSALLANEAGLWPVMHQGDLNVPALYYADQWGRAQTESAIGLRLRYLYVDERWADGPPLYSASPSVGYFYDGETPIRQQLTRGQLSKFASVQGMDVVYRHGPVAIYDLAGLGVPAVQTGWVGEARRLDLPTQVVAGLLLGLVLGLLTGTPRWSAATSGLRSYRAVAGPTLTFATGIAALCIVSIALLSANIWVEPAIWFILGLTMLAVNPQWTSMSLHALRGFDTRRNRRLLGAFVAVGLLVVVPIVRSLLDVYAVNGRGVQAILADPSTVMVPAQRNAPTSASPSK